jgi:hypothetical protein
MHYFKKCLSNPIRWSAMFPIVHLFRQLLNTHNSIHPSFPKHFINFDPQSGALIQRPPNNFERSSPAWRSSKSDSSECTATKPTLVGSDPTGILHVVSPRSIVCQGWCDESDNPNSAENWRKRQILSSNDLTRAVPTPRAAILNHEISLTNFNWDKS